MSMRANSERLAAPQVLADYFLASSHNDLGSLPAAFQPEVANRGRNVP
jgi:hypothetical protein